MSSQPVKSYRCARDHRNATMARLSLKEDGEHDWDLIVGACRQCGVARSESRTGCSYGPGVLSITYLYHRRSIDKLVAGLIDNT